MTFRLLRFRNWSFTINTIPHKEMVIERYKGEMKPRIVFFVYYDNLNVIGSLLYAIKKWLDSGYAVSVVALTDDITNLFGAHSQVFENVKIRMPLPVRIVSMFFSLSGTALKRVGLSIPLSPIAGFIRMCYFSLCCSLKTKKDSFIIATDPPSLWAAAINSRKTGNPYIYSVRELFLSGDTRNVVDKAVKYLERRANKKAFYTVEFDDVRAGLLKDDNGLRPESMLVVPNAPPGNAERKNVHYFHKKFQIPIAKKIVLYTGGIADYNLTYEIMNTVDSWPLDVLLVMHCWGAQKDIEQLKRYATRFQREIFFSTEMMPFSEIANLYASCNVGLALYGDGDLNHKYTGLSSGKMFNFLKECVPVITNNTVACKKAIGENGCGICINDLSEISNAIKIILADEEVFRGRCQASFSAFSFDNNYQKLIEAVKVAAA